MVRARSATNDKLVPQTANSGGHATLLIVPVPQSVASTAAPREQRAIICARARGASTLKQDSGIHPAYTPVHANECTEPQATPTTRSLARERTKRGMVSCAGTP